MSKKAKYNWNQPSLFSDDNLHPSDRELQGYKIVTNKNGVTQRLAIIRRTKEDFIRKSQAIWGDQYDYSETVYTGSKSPVTIRCKKHNYYFTVSIAQNHYMKPHGTYKPTGCPYCSRENGNPYNRRLLPEERERRKQEEAMLKQQKAEERERRKAESAAKRKRKYEERKAKRWQEYQDRLQQQKEQTRLRHEAERAERQCQREEQRRQHIADLQARFREEAPRKQGKGYIYKGIEQITTKQSKVMVHCPNPDHEWHPMRVDLILQGCKCRECAGRHQPVGQRCQEWIDKCIEKYGEGRYDYSRAHEDYVNNDSLVWIRCCIHDYWFQQTPDNNLRTVNGSCPICSLEFRESEGEAEIRRWLLKHGITNFKQDEVTLPVEDPRCKRQYLRPDFWLPDYNLFIEYNGEQHYEDVEHFHADGWTFEDQQIRDKAVRQYCQRHGYRLLEIPYWDFKRIDEILSAYFEPKTE